jgi:hypothetical protein
MGLCPNKQRRRSSYWQDEAHAGHQIFCPDPSGYHDLIGVKRAIARLDPDDANATQI